MALWQYLLNVASFLAAAFLFDYIKNKGKNRATKEDIGQITAIVEEIKTELANKTEVLKAELSLVNTHKLNMKNAEREALFEYNKKNVVWLYSIVGFSLDDYSANNIDDLDEVRKDFHRKKYELDVAAAHLSLFDNDNEFIALKRDMTITTLEYLSMVESVIRNAKMRFKIDKKKIKNAKPDEEMLLIKQHSRKISELTDQLHKDGIELYKKVIDLHSQVAAKIIDRLKQIDRQESVT